MGGARIDHRAPRVAVARRDNAAIRTTRNTTDGITRHRPDFGPPGARPRVGFERAEISGMDQKKTFFALSRLTLRRSLSPQLHRFR